MKDSIGTGRRKTAVASVRLRQAKAGKVEINGRAFEEYFPLEIQRATITAPLEKAGLANAFAIMVNVRGGGVEAQAEAVRLGIARALVHDNDALKHVMKEDGFLTRDSRKKERKKYGRAKARKRFQFSKR